jgi:polysaccharide biosynthesis/export protein
MNRSSCSTRIALTQPPQTFFLKLQSVIKVAGFIGLLTLLALAGGGCETNAKSTTLSGQAEVPKHVILAPGDVVKLTFSANSELNQSQKIRADGKLSLPLIGEVDAAQKTVAQLQSELVELYKPQIKIPEVTVSLEKSTSTVTVSGAVGKPGRIGFERPTTVFEAIMEAGGPTAYGNLGHVRLIRIVNGVQKSQVLDLHRALKGEEIKPFYVRDQDVIYVPQSTF